MQKYVAHGLYGRWKGTGDSFAAGQLYDPGIATPFFGFSKQSTKTIECAFDPTYTNSWYDRVCFDEFCDCKTINRTTETCKDCITIKCHLDECDE